ncbi:MAG TPA: hypothetical protein PLU73_01480 [Bacteroidia bacterium]|nr:hypothetical protein [Bacteroidia bacterium]
MNLNHNNDNKYKLLEFRIFILLFISFTCLNAQEGDSAKIYKKIKKFSERRTLTTWMYDAIFTEPSPEEYPVEPTAPEKHVNPFIKQKDRIIRKVNITVYNPFGHKVQDSVRKFDRFLENSANHLHISTRKWIIINRLLFKEYDTLSPLALSETERLLRVADFINDAKVYVTDTLNSDSVTVNVDVYDRWPISIPMHLTPNSADIRFRNQNFLGIGQQFDQYVWYNRDNLYNYRGYYTIANLDNTYISSQLSYKIEDGKENVALAFDKPYFSPLAKWAGGLLVSHNWDIYHYNDTSPAQIKSSPLNSLYYDVWLGKAFKVGKKKTIFNQSTNIIVGGRYYNTIFLARPDFSIDTSRSNRSTWAYVGNVGFSLQQYYKDRFIYRFGSFEDVPEGLIVQAIYGVSKKEQDPYRYYIGAEIAKAKKFRIGNLATSISSGMYYSEHLSNNITAKFRLTYLGNLIKQGRWYFRQFAYYDLLHGVNKPTDENITIKGDELYGFNSGTLTANTKMIMNLESVAYAPYNVIGFKFGAVAMAGFALLEKKLSTIDKSPLFQAYSIGLLIRNEHLVSSTFQISVGMYPFLPGLDKNTFAFNPITSFTLRVRGFAMGRPEFIGY